MKGQMGRANKEQGQKYQQECPRCGLTQEEWLGSQGQGYMQQDDEETYCCQGCAEDGECTCLEGEGI